MAGNHGVARRRRRSRMVPEEQTMSKKSEHNGENEARELYEHRHDPEEWDEEPERIEVRPARSSVLSVRLPRTEFDALERAAAAEGETLSEYVRQAVMRRIEGTGAPAMASVVGHVVGMPGIPVGYMDVPVWTSGGTEDVRIEDRARAGR